MPSRPFALSEPLERRLLLASATVADDILVVTGDNGIQNHIVVRLSGDQSHVVVQFDGKVKRFDISNDNIDGVQLIGGNKADYLACYNGVDNLNPFTIRCTLIGGAGADTMIGGDGHNFFVGGSGDKVMVGGTEDDTMVGGHGNDTITGGDGGDVIFGGQGNDVLTGGINGRNIIFGGSGNCTINGVGGDDELFGDTGNDRIIANSGDTIYSGTGKDTVVVDPGNVGSNGEVHSGEFSGLQEVLNLIDPNAGRFRAAGGKPSDPWPLL